MASRGDGVLGYGEGLMLAAVFLALAFIQPSGDVCDIDRSALLELDQKAFDQDFNGGWRKIADNGCKKEAADLIRDWRRIHTSESTTLYWHEGQMRAEIGDSPAAVELFKKAIKTPEEEAGFGWNLYVEGSVAFLNRDKLTLQRARDALAVLPKPEGLSRMVDQDGNPVEIEWPMNLNILDAFIQCWDETYSNAYQCGSKKP
jgi:hypothetical protein